MPNGTLTKPQCNSCYYYEVSMTQCRHYPPELFMAPHGQSQFQETNWPHVNASDWCGKHSDLHVIGGDDVSG